MKSFEPFLSRLAMIPDPRRAEGKLYGLSHVLLFSILAVVTGANSYRGIRTFIKARRAQLNKAFKINWKKAPVHTAIRYILQGLNVADVEKVFRDHAANLNASAGTAGTRIVSLDGKVLRGSFDAFNDVKAKQILNAFATDTALVLARSDIDDKSNEIPAAQKFLEELNVAGHIVTLDALHCQKKPSKPRHARAHLIVQLTDNQETLCRKVEAFCRKAKPLSGVQIKEPKGRNRRETRTVAVFDASPVVTGTPWEPHVKAIIQVKRIVHNRQPATGLGKTSFENAFYLSNRPIRAQQAATATRKHWGIENKLHYTRDVTLHEDASRIRCNPGLFARLRRFAYNILRFNQADTIAQDRYAAALGGLTSLASMIFCIER